jgi:type IV pilus assembly protein PilB
VTCKTDVKLHPEVLRELGLSDEEAKKETFKEGKGCVDCNNTGYKGRLGVYEVMNMTSKIRDLILDRSSVSEIKKQAMADGMLTLRKDGLMKLKNGITTAEEVLKETAADH